MFIYKITNTTNGDFYVGKTAGSIAERFSKHQYNTRYEKVKDTHLYRAMNKYGLDAFVIEALEEVSSDIDERERHWISKLKPHYNMTEGGDGGDMRHSAKWRAAIQKHHEERTPESYATYGMLGKKFPEEAKKKVGKANSYPVSIDGVVYESIKKDQAELGWSEKKVRYRIDSTNYPNCIRLRGKRDCPRR